MEITTGEVFRAETGIGSGFWRIELWTKGESIFAVDGGNIADFGSGTLFFAATAGTGEALSLKVTVCEAFRGAVHVG